MQKYTTYLLLTFLLATFTLSADPFFKDDCSLCRGKVELAPAYVHVDFLHDGHTQNSMNLIAVKGDLNYRVWSGLTLKPTFLYGKGKHDHEIATGGLGVGFCIPLTCYKVVITPVAGLNFGYLRTSFKYKLTPEVKIPVKERFRTRSPYVGLEVSWTFIPSWRIVLSYQYSWSRTHTKLRPRGPIDKKSDSKGSAYAGMIEHDLNESWSVNVGAAYNNSLSKEKFGVRAWGLKLGVAYWF